MPSLPLLLLLWGVGVHVFIAPAETRERDATMIQKYLQKYYNLKTGTNKSGGQRNSGLVVEKLKEMQKFFGLKVTWRPDAETLHMMQQGWCGVPDVAPYVLTEGNPRWEHTDLTYRIENYTPDLPRAEVDRAIEKAFQLWSDVSPLNFTKISEGQADIMLSFGEVNHGDKSDFGRIRSPLPHVFPPGRGMGGGVHFDEEKTWTDDFRNYNLYYVAAHELGHSLGLLHSDDIGSLMFPRYVYYGDALLSPKDIDAIQAIYGPSTNPIQPKEPPIPRACDSKLTFDAVAKIRGESFFFKNMFFLCTGVFYETLDPDVISDLGNGVDAAYEVARRDEVFFFKGGKYWAIKGHRALYGYPRDIYSSFGFPQRLKKIDAAVHEEETGMTYFFAASELWRQRQADGQITQRKELPFQKSFSNPAEPPSSLGEWTQLDQESLGSLSVIVTPCLSLRGKGPVGWS
ncbi:interstitial collagenase-like [Prionailurus viverrinus]|uniref:interstitial collagenase-like n=1 Tax=Prionailurus viverrinus TaxID=61388 RepID=UPI001FF6D991|nr:interstitial collagenase-like [Prionailurus viverrinus]